VAVGTLFPQAWIDGSTGPLRMDDWLGCGWRLLLKANSGATWTQAADHAHPHLELKVQALNSPEFKESSGVLAAWFDRMACQAALVRPDHYVYGVFSSPEDLQSALLALQP